ncbi:hypothetical protein GCM10009736_65200 [Actinomadura bangladeshensis]
MNIYNEARAVRNLSARSCCTLLRLAVQDLIDELEPASGSIYEKIGRLVERGLDPTIQKAMDSLRIVGNESAHASSISLDADAEMIPALFDMLNLTVWHILSRPRHVDQFFASLPEGARNAIQRRDTTQ